MSYYETCLAHSWDPNRNEVMEITIKLKSDDSVQNYNIRDKSDRRIQEEDITNVYNVRDGQSRRTSFKARAGSQRRPVSTLQRNVRLVRRGLQFCDSLQEKVQGRGERTV